ncbi:hypothetical protein ZHAS_00008844 [Anopheles sinensis]|uniref:Uncharacterized protein n=1 Tax=Anopheles sinensis TaxID=74873 RepID=A0A084VTG0_ANOSI|nr:hypothetical protein ZHAS_00008844 [Anopheles sinensis]
MLRGDAHDTTVETELQLAKCIDGDDSTTANATELCTDSALRRRWRRHAALSRLHSLTFRLVSPWNAFLLGRSFQIDCNETRAPHRRYTFVGTNTPAEAVVPCTEEDGVWRGSSSAFSRPSNAKIFGVRRFLLKPERKPAPLSNRYGEESVCHGKRGTV